MEQQALVESYREYAELANKRFKGGLESFLTVLDAERQLFSAKLDLAAVQRDQLLILVQLYKALGGGPELYRNATVPRPMPCDAFPGECLPKSKTLSRVEDQASDISKGTFYELVNVQSR